MYLVYFMWLKRGGEGTRERGGRGEGEGRERGGRGEGEGRVKGRSQKNIMNSNYITLLIQTHYGRTYSEEPPKQRRGTSATEVQRPRVHSDTSVSPSPLAFAMESRYQINNIHVK